MIIDTSLLLDLTERRSPAAIQAVRALGRPSVRSFIVEAELLAGVETAHARQLPQADIAMRNASLQAYRELSVVPDRRPLDALAHEFARITRVCVANQLRLGQNDRWILAEALTLETGVLTADHAMHQVADHVDTDRDPHSPLAVLVQTSPPVT